MTDERADPGRRRRPGRERERAFWTRHRTLFWILHSGWALATGVVVVLLARERYGFVPWVVVFLVLTWVSTLFFGTGATIEEKATVGAPTLRQEMASYVTRTMYQETLFFLLPFYAYSTVPASPNVAFLVLLGGLAGVSCLDLVFDGWLRTRPVIGLLFFASVAFAALNLLLPVLFAINPRHATPLAAGLAVASALPLAYRAAGGGRATWIRLGLAAAAALGLAIGVPSLVPPVPLRMTEATFATSIDPESLEPGGVLDADRPATAVDDAIVVLVEVFAPAAIPTAVSLEWSHDGETIRTSRDVGIVAHEAGFRVWDAWRPPSGRVEPGRYTVTLRTGNGRVFGKEVLRVAGD